ncbi:MAG: hypothetical protein ACYC1D_16820 [Acidimicrobiales bacterium]
MDWQRIGHVIEAKLVEVLTRLSAVLPGVVGPATLDQHRPRIVCNAHFQATLCVTYQAGQEYADLVISFRCVAESRAQSPKGPSRDVASFDVARGNDVEIAALAPLLLPPERGSVPYVEAVDAYVSLAMAFLDEHFDVIVEALGLREVEWLPPLLSDSERWERGLKPRLPGGPAPALSGAATDSTTPPPDEAAP